MRPQELLVVAIVVGAAGTARGGAFEFRELEARKACLTGNADKGVEILADLFLATDDPTYIFNQGRCFQQSDRFEEAIGKFREYLRKARKSGAGRSEAEKYIAECQRLMQQGTVEQRPVAESPAVSDARETGTESSVQHARDEGGEKEVAEAGVERPSAIATSVQEGRRGAGLRTAGITVAASGAAMFLGGVALNVKANRLTAEVNRFYDREKDEDRQTYRTMALACYGLGVAALLSGAVLYYMGWDAGRRTVVAVAPYGEGGLLIEGAF
jgi:hypothetical protein